jgi:hypothetical protein
MFVVQLGVRFLAGEVLVHTKSVCGWCVDGVGVMCGGVLRVASVNYSLSSHPDYDWLLLRAIIALVGSVADEG